MIGRADRLEQLVAAILDQDRPVVVPGALGMGKTTLALAAAYDHAGHRTVRRGRRFFVNLEPAPDADGLLRRLAADLGVAASGAASEVEAKIAAACATAPTLAILDNLETPWRKDTAAIEALLGRLAAIEGLRLVITIRGEPPDLPGAGALTLQDVERLSEPRRERALSSPRRRAVRRRPGAARPARRPRRPSAVDRASGGQCARQAESERVGGGLERRGAPTAAKAARATTA